MRGHLLPPTAESISMNKLLLLPTIQNEKEERTSRLYDSKSEQKKTAGQILIKILQFRIRFDWGISFLFNCQD